jgi:CDP-paratose 2-epimerase
MGDTPTPRRRSPAEARDTLRLRTQLSWAEYHTKARRDWYDWLLPRLGARFDLLPCIHYTPPSISRTGAASGPPPAAARLRRFHRCDAHPLRRAFRGVELWNEPNNLLDWDWRVDPDHALFCEMVGRRRALGAPARVRPGPRRAVPLRPGWLDLMGARGIPRSSRRRPPRLSRHLGQRGRELARLAAPSSRDARDPGSLQRRAAEIWITEAGYSTWRHDEIGQVRRFLEACDAPADRLYWYGWRDVCERHRRAGGAWFDPRHYHMGAVDAGNRPSCSPASWPRAASGGWREVAGPGRARACARPPSRRHYRGGGFIGTNLADSFLRDGDEVSCSTA